MIEFILLVAFACCVGTQFCFVDGALSQDEEGTYRKDRMRFAPIILVTADCCLHLLFYLIIRKSQTSIELWRRRILR
jgi:hypothetical protein